MTKEGEGIQMGPEALEVKGREECQRQAQRPFEILLLSVSFRKKEDAFFSVIWISLEPKLIITYNTVYLREKH